MVGEVRIVQLEQGLGLQLEVVLELDRGNELAHASSSGSGGHLRESSDGNLHNEVHDDTLLYKHLPNEQVQDGSKEPFHDLHVR